MSKKALVIVESPSKAKTIQKYLGRDYIVKASVGHIIDLPKSKLGVDPDKNFKIDYQPIAGKKKVVDELKKAIEKVTTLYLATDPDREGEAIAWHINQELNTKGKDVHRILLNAITKKSVQEAIANPTKLDTAKVNAQQARRVLDRLVGYKISPLLWDKVKRGLSAGRVQSVALRLVVEREKEAKAFKPEEYWSIGSEFLKDGQGFPTELFKIEGKDPVLPSKTAVDAAIKQWSQANFVIDSIEEKERQRRAAPPFTTSRLQQEAARKLGFSAKKTMTLAQHLYEGVDLGDLGQTGLITYMRTDSVRIEPEALAAVRQYIVSEYGKAYCPAEPNFYKTKKNAQDAHEAIRPASLELHPDKVARFVDKDELRLYQLIWNRFISCQMTPAVYDQTTVDVVGKGQDGLAYTFRARGSVIKFSGFTAVYTEGSDEESEDDRALKLPAIKPGDSVKQGKIAPDQHFTQPPPRFTDASLVKALEEKGIGRPSTYASILSNLQDREYVEKRENKYYPSELGTVVTDLLVESFPDVLNVEFTADMETRLDEIADGNADWKKELSNFWKPFEKTLEAAKKNMKNLKAQEIRTDITCEKCGKVMLIKWGKLGSFLACSGYPECSSTQDFKKDDAGTIIVVPKEFTDKKCKKCTKPLIVKSGKYGRFLACSDYPACKHTEPVTMGIACPLCKEGEMAEKRSRFNRVFYSCNRWPDCSYSTWDKPIVKPCPDCKWPIMTEKLTKRNGVIHRCPQKECGWTEIIGFPGEPLTAPSATSSA